MDSKDDSNAEAHHRHNTLIDNSDTMALQKKRARRVSFAETTSIRLFNRDAGFDETPLMETAKIRGDSPGEFGSGQQLEPNMEFGGLNGGNEDDGEEDEEMDMRRAFLRPVGSPSPGGSTFGSASSTDEDNFFGPVSANFIKPGRLSDSAASDDNPDQTMDSTAFSMHYRSLARSESGVGLKTPTGGQLFFEEKTPMSANIGSSMSPTLGKKAIPISSIPATKVSRSGSHNSNDMSLVEENPYKYDFDNLSPRSDALFAESLLHVSAYGDVIISTSPKPNEAAVFPSIDHGNNLLSSDYLPLETDSLVVLKEGESANSLDPGEANAFHGIVLSDTSLGQFSSNLLITAASNKDNDKPIKSPYQLSKIGPETPLKSTSSSPVECQQIILPRASPSKPWDLASPLRQPSSMLRNGTLGHQETDTSIQKSISKLELLERSAFSSAFSTKSDNSFVKTLDFFKSPNFDSLLGGNRHISKINFVEDSVSEEKLTSVHQSREKRYASSLDHIRAEILNPNISENHLEEQSGLKASGKLPDGLTAQNISRDQINCGVTVPSPSKITWSVNNLMCDLFTSKHFNEDTLMTETESLLTEIASGDGGKSVLTPNLPSPHRCLGKIIPASPDPQSTRAYDLYPQSQFKNLSDPYNDRDSSPQRISSGANLSNETANSGGVSKGMKGELVSSYVDVNSPENLIEIQGIDNGEDAIYKSKEIFGSPNNFSTPTKEKNYQILHSKNLGVANLARRGMSRIEDNLSGADLKGSVSPSDYGNLDKTRLQKLVELPVASPSRKEHSNGMHSPRTTRLEKISSSKRNVELLLRDTQHRNEMTLTQRSHKLQKGGNCDQDTILHPDESGALVVPEKKKWTDTYSKYSEDMKNLVSRSTERLNYKMIDALEDGLVHQQRSKVYEMLHHGFIIQNPVILNDLQLEKMAETKLLLHQLVFETAKLQLKHVKKERLLKRSQQLNSRLHKLQELGEDIASHPLQTCATKVVVDAVGNQTLSVNLQKGLEVSHGKLAAMRQALDTLDKKILNLTRIFHACCKIKSEPNCADTIGLINEHLLKKSYCRSTRLKMQMWVVQSVGSVDGQANVILNYLDFIIQRIKIIVGPASSLSSSFSLNEANILKSFPNMDACIAFAFVFDAETVHGAKTLPQETQVTSSLLGTLLDVVEEVQLAKMKLQNLTQSSFSSPSVERLDLMLCFFNFTSGRKANITLDMSCLKRGIYPSDVVPLQLGDNEKSSSSQLNFDVIKEQVKGVTTGYTRILRLCECVCQVVRASTV